MTVAAALEGNLPPCLRIAVFAGWRVVFHDGLRCDRGIDYHVALSPIGHWAKGSHGVMYPWARPHDLSQSWHTRDPEEAERLWEEACEKLRAVACE